VLVQRRLGEDYKAHWFSADDGSGVSKHARLRNAVVLSIKGSQWKRVLIGIAAICALIAPALTSRTDEVTTVDGQARHPIGQ
jgi:hypothetical protein